MLKVTMLLLENLGLMFAVVYRIKQMFIPTYSKIREIDTFAVVSLFAELYNFCFMVI